jgi:hypothetical protein
MNRLLALLPLLLTLLAVIGLLLYGPIAQLPHYHNFADHRGIYRVPNAADVLSNTGFAVLGLWGPLAGAAKAGTGCWRARLLHVHGRLGADCCGFQSLPSRT